MIAAAPAQARSPIAAQRAPMIVAVPGLVRLPIVLSSFTDETPGPVEVDTSPRRRIDVDPEARTEPAPLVSRYPTPRPLARARETPVPSIVAAPFSSTPRTPVPQASPIASPEVAPTRASPFAPQLATATARSVRRREELRPRSDDPPDHLDRRDRPLHRRRDPDRDASALAPRREVS